MTLQEIIQSLDELSVVEQTSLFNVLQLRLAKTTQKEQQDKNRGERFLQGIRNFRAAIEREELVFSDDDFANLRG